MRSRSTVVLLIVLALAVLAVGAGTYHFSRSKPEQYRTYFNLLYRHNFGVFNTAPNALLAQTVSRLPAGRALDIAMGEGRNAVFLAAKGWEVTGFDISDEALRQAQAHAASAGVKISTVRAASEDFDYGHEQWDLIVFSYAFAPIHDPAYIRRIRDSLKPGGYIVFEHYLDQVTMAPGTPARGELPQVFTGFQILLHQELTDRGDWLFRRRAPLARMVARR
jgi:2-polyprenyl-3-methyl-5-hydroxy-6-metoxy-1,4-benzoquinol methylase